MGKEAIVARGLQRALAAMLILLCYLVLAGVIDDLPSRKLRLFSLVAISSPRCRTWW